MASKMAAKGHVTNFLLLIQIKVLYISNLETCLALRYCFFEVLGSESVKQTIQLCNL